MYIKYHNLLLYLLFCLINTYLDSSTLKKKALSLVFISSSILIFPSGIIFFLANQHTLKGRLPYFLLVFLVVFRSFFRITNQAPEIEICWFFSVDLLSLL